MRRIRLELAVEGPWVGRLKLTRPGVRLLTLMASADTHVRRFDGRTCIRVAQSRPPPAPIAWVWEPLVVRRFAVCPDESLFVARRAGAKRRRAREVHEGRIVIEGRASERLAFFQADGTPYGGAVSADVIELKTKAFQALRHMGFKQTEVRRALDATNSHVGNLTLESIVRQALLVLT